MKITLLNRQRSFPLPKKKLEEVIGKVVETFELDFFELTFTFVSKKKIASLHKELFDDPTPTDCITLSFDPPFAVGEIFICPAVAKEYSEEHDLPYEQELLRYMIHGLLHLLGYNDISNKERARMRQLENRTLRRLAKEGHLT